MNHMKILILTFDAGFGHRRAANAIAKALTKNDGNKIECKVVNPLKEEGLSGVIYKSQSLYDDVSTKHRAVYQSVYNMINHYPTSETVDQVVTQFLIQETMNTILDEQPDGIISTFPFFSTSVRRILFLLNIHIPFYSVVTDLDDVHRIWFHPGPNKYFVASDQLKKQAIKNGINQNKVVISGIPVDTRIAEETRDKAAIRQQLGWDTDLPTITAIGSKRVQNFLEKLTIMENCNIPLQLSIVAGGDKEIYQAITSREWKIPVHCYNYVENIPEMLRASDLLITKSGGLITSEGLASGLPMILIDSISGQETGNVNYLLKNNVAVTINTAEELQKIIECWLANDQAVLKKYAENAGRIGKPRAAFVIGETMVDEIQKSKYAARNKAIWNRLQSLSELRSIFTQNNAA